MGYIPPPPPLPVSEKEPLWYSFKFDQFGMKSLLVQAVEHVVDYFKFDFVTPETMAKMSKELNELITCATQPYDSPPCHPIDFNFCFKSYSDDYSRRNYIQVIDKRTDSVVMEWEV